MILVEAVDIRGSILLKVLEFRAEFNPLKADPWPRNAQPEATPRLDLGV